MLLTQFLFLKICIKITREGQRIENLAVLSHMLHSLVNILDFEHKPLFKLIIKR